MRISSTSSLWAIGFLVSMLAASPAAAARFTLEGEKPVDLDKIACSLKDGILRVSAEQTGLRQKFALEMPHLMRNTVSWAGHLTSDENTQLTFLDDSDVLWSLTPDSEPRASCQASLKREPKDDSISLLLNCQNLRRSAGIGGIVGLSVDEKNPIRCALAK